MEDDCVTTDAVPSPKRENIPPKNRDNIDLEKLNINDNIPDNADEKSENTSRTQEKPTNSEQEEEESKPKIKSKVKKPKPTFKSAQTVNITVSHSKGFHIGNNYTIESNQQESQTSQDPLVKTPGIKALFKDESRVTSDQLHDISPVIGKGWMRLGRILGLKQGMIEQIDENYKNNKEEVIYQMLLEWVQSNGSKASIRVLCEALETTGQFDAIRQLAGQ